MDQNCIVRFFGPILMSQKGAIVFAMRQSLQTKTYWENGEENMAFSIVFHLVVIYSIP